MTIYRNAYPFLLAILCSSFLTASLSYAQGQKQFANQGATELGGSFSFQSITPVVNGVSRDNTSEVSITPTIGYFVSDGVEIGMDPFAINIISGGGTTTQVSLLFSGAYNFTTEKAGYPFVEGLLGYTSVSDGSTESGVSWGIRGGLKEPIAGQALVDIAAQYLQITLDPSNSVNRYGYNQFSIVAGLSIWL